ncbi:MAG: hypothetical protein ACRD06_01715 [Terriglobia bacterium]
MSTASKPRGRKRRTPKYAKQVGFYLGAKERLVLSIIETRLQKRGDGGDSPSEIVSAALWHYVDCVEKIPRGDIDRLLPDEQRELMPPAKPIPLKMPSARDSNI